MEVYVRGMFDDFINLFGQYPKHDKMHGYLGTSLTKNDHYTLLNGEYFSLVSKILYFVKKLPAIFANTCQELSQHLKNPRPAHWKAVKLLVGYLHKDRLAGQQS